MVSALKAAVCKPPPPEATAPDWLRKGRDSALCCIHLDYYSRGFFSRLHKFFMLSGKKKSELFSLYSESKLQARLACPLQNFGLDKMLA